MHRIDTMNWNKYCSPFRNLLLQSDSWRNLKFDNSCYGKLKLHHGNDKALLQIYNLYIFIYKLKCDMIISDMHLKRVTSHVLRLSDGAWVCVVLKLSSYCKFLSTVSVWWSLATAFSFVRLEITLTDSDMLIRYSDSCIICVFFLSYMYVL
jgi:hypothetical protein